MLTSFELQSTFSPRCSDASWCREDDKLQVQVKDAAGRVAATASIVLGRLTPDAPVQYRVYDLLSHDSHAPCGKIKIGLRWTQQDPPTVTGFDQRGANLPWFLKVSCYAIASAITQDLAFYSAALTQFSVFGALYYNRLEICMVWQKAAMHVYHHGLLYHFMLELENTFLMQVGS
jgi:hypothetical protein